MTKQEIYEQIVQLTLETHSTGSAEKIFAAAKEGNLRKVNDEYVTFQRENFELWERIINFGPEYNQIDLLEEREIFGDKTNEDEYIWLFDPEEIDGLSLCVLIFLGEIDETHIFYEWPSRASSAWIDSIKNAGYEKLAEFLENECWIDQVGENVNEGDDYAYSDIWELLVDVLKEDTE